MYVALAGRTPHTASLAVIIHLRDVISPAWCCHNLCGWLWAHCMPSDHRGRHVVGLRSVAAWLMARLVSDALVTRSRNSVAHNTATRSATGQLETVLTPSVSFQNRVRRFVHNSPFGRCFFIHRHRRLQTRWRRKSPVDQQPPTAAPSVASCHGAGR